MGGQKLFWDIRIIKIMVKVFVGNYISKYFYFESKAYEIIFY